MAKESAVTIFLIHIVDILLLPLLLWLLIPCIVDGAATFAPGAAETKSFKETTFDARTKAGRTSWSPARSSAAVAAEANPFFRPSIPQRNGEVA